MAKKNPETTPGYGIMRSEDPTADVPMAAFDFGDDAGKGFENQTKEDFSIPFLTVLQGLSPQVQMEDSPYKVGMIYNTVTERGVKGSEGLKIVPVTTEHKYVEYVPRDAGGGFVAVHDPNSALVEDAKRRSTKYGKYKTPEGNELVETFALYAIDADTLEGFVIPFSSTKIKIYKDWNSRINLFNHRMYGIKSQPPMYAHVVRLTTEKENRTSGDSYNYRMNPVNPDRVVDGKLYPAILCSMIGPNDPRYQAAKGFLEMIQSGMAKADHASHSAPAEDVGGTKEASGADIPF